MPAIRPAKSGTLNCGLSPEGADASAMPRQSGSATRKTTNPAVRSRGRFAEVGALIGFLTIVTSRRNDLAPRDRIVLTFLSLAFLAALPPTSTLVERDLH